MIFCSHHFLAYFLPAVLLLYYGAHALGSPRARTLVLVLASYVFYGWERADFLVLILFSTVLDWFCGKAAASASRQVARRAVMISVIGNLGLLGYFKYFNLLAETLGQVSEALGGSPLGIEKVLLPMGISFYTFQTMSYTIDIARGHAKPARSIVDMACYVALFPQLVAGPIVRYRELDGQLRSRRHTLEKMGRGALLFMIGFSKKILIADAAARVAAPVFAGVEGGELGFGAAALGTLAAGMRLYFDFSGYSDMARGLGLLFGFEFPINFLSPFRSGSITELWQRWHISLSTWLRDYLYIPLGGNRGSNLRTYVNLTLTMVLGGLWHGASFTFLAWGVYNGILLALERGIGKRPLWFFLPRPGRVFACFSVTMLGLVVFRSPDFTVAMSIYEGLAGAHGLGTGWGIIADSARIDLFLTAVGTVLCFGGIRSEIMAGTRHPVWATLVLLFSVPVFVLALAHMYWQGYSPFVYFQF